MITISPRDLYALENGGLVYGDVLYKNIKFPATLNVGYARFAEVDRPTPNTLHSIDLEGSAKFVIRNSMLEQISNNPAVIFTSKLPTGEVDIELKETV